MVTHVNTRRGALAILALAAGGGLAACDGAGSGAGSQGSGGAASTGTLAYSSDGNVVTLTTDGKQRAQLTRVSGGALARDPVWAPDGKRIAYAYTPPLPSTRGPTGQLPLPATDIFVMNADGSDAKALVTHEAPGVGYETPAWAPDGKWLYVTYTALLVESNVVRDQTLEVARLPLDGGARQTLAPSAAFPSLSRDGKRLAFVSATLSGQALVVSDPDGKNARTVVPQGQLDGISYPRLSPDGKSVVFSAIAPMLPIPTTTPPPGRAAPTPATRSDAGSRLLTARRDATAALLGALRPRSVQAHGLPMDLYLVGADGSGLRRVTQLGEDDPAGVWSPDGRRLAIRAGGGMYVLNADGSALTSVDQRGGQGAADWKPV